MEILYYSTTCTDANAEFCYYIEFTDQICIYTLN